jgi:NADH-quinone oxidoreductase subunit A
MNPPPPITGMNAIGFVLLIAIALSLILICVSVFLGPKRPTRTKTMPYESGMTPVGAAHDRFSVHYYMVAMLYIIFDVETIFLYPWAAILRRELGWFGWAEVMTFMVVLFVGYVYLVKKGALEWE